MVATAHLPYPAIVADGQSIVAAVTPAWAARHRGAFERSGIAVDFVADGGALADRLARDWAVEIVVLDLALAVPELGMRLGIAGPRLLAFGDPANAAIALAANLVDFLPDNLDAATLIAALAAAEPGSAQVGVAELSDRATARLGRLGAEAEQIAAALARLPLARLPRAISAAPTAAEVTAASVRALIRARRARDRFLPGDIFGDPAWDMLLDLTAARLEGQRVAVSSLCIAAAVPTTTALRWIRNLCDAGLFVRDTDPSDARRAFIGLATPTATAMFAYLATFRDAAG